MKIFKRKYIIFLGVLALFYCAYWFGLSFFIEAKLNEFLEKNKGQSVVFVFKEKKIDGFPFWVRLSFEELNVRDVSKHIHFSSQHIEFKVRPWLLNTVFAEFEGLQKLKTPQQYNALTFKADDNLSKLSFDVVNKTWKFKTELENFTFKDQLGVETMTGYVNAVVETFTVGTPAHKYPSVTSMIELKDIHLGRDIAGKKIAMRDNRLFKKIDHLMLNLDLMGVIPPDHFPQNIKYWRDSGGKIVIHSLETKADEITATMAGNVSLDKNNYPIAQLNTEIVGYQRLINKLVDQRVISKDASNALGFLSLFFTKPSQENEGKKVKTKLVAKDGGLYLGSIKLSKLPKMFSE